jgi:TatD DNase family protein
MLVDTHAHLMDPAFHDDLPSVLERAAAAGVETIVCVGYDLASSQAAVALAQEHLGLFATVGIHPNYVAAAPAGWVGTVRALARAPRVVAVGETGLDYFRTFTEPADQRRAFHEHLAIAADLRLPAVIHCRDAERDVLAALTVTDGTVAERGVLHCFSGSQATMEAAVEGGYYISFAGNVTFKNAESLRTVAACVPSERLLIETDAPYLSPVPHRGQRNEPARVVSTAACMAGARGVTIESLAPQLTANARRLFHLHDEARA